MKVKKWDVIIIGLFVIISFLPAAIFSIRANQEVGGYYAVITVQGEIFDTVELTGHKGREEIIVETSLGKNIIEIVDEKIGMYEADCPDKVCYVPEYISKSGETIVCLPHRVVIEVKGEIPDKDQHDIVAGRFIRYE